MIGYEGILTADIIRQQLKQHEEAAAKAKMAAGQREVEPRKARKGTNGVSTNGVTAKLLFFDRGTFAAAPLVLTPFVRDQKAAGKEKKKKEKTKFKF